MTVLASHNARTKNRKSIGRPAKSQQQPDKEITVNIRLTPDELARVDASVKSRRARIPRHTWLLEAIFEKLDREMDAEDLRIAEQRLMEIREGRSSTVPLGSLMRKHGLED